VFLPGVAADDARFQAGSKSAEEVDLWRKGDVPV
jgi:hypothetical protein